MTNSSISMPGQEALQPLMQPYVSLTQRNMQLFTSFSASPEMVGLWLRNGQSMFSQAVQQAASGKTSPQPHQVIEQVQANMSDVGQSRAFASLVQGLMQSHLQFLTDLGQAHMTALSRMPTQVLQSLQQAGVGAAPAAEVLEEQPARARRKAH